MFKVFSRFRLFDLYPLKTFLRELSAFRLVVGLLDGCLTGLTGSSTSLMSMFTGVFVASLGFRLVITLIDDFLVPGDDLLSLSSLNIFRVSLVFSAHFSWVNVVVIIIIDYL